MSVSVSSPQLHCYVFLSSGSRCKVSQPGGTKNTTLYWAKKQKTKHFKRRIKVRNWGKEELSLFAGKDHCRKSIQVTKGVLSSGEWGDPSKKEKAIIKKGFPEFNDIQESSETRQKTTQVLGWEWCAVLRRCSPPPGQFAAPMMQEGGRMGPESGS